MSVAKRKIVFKEVHENFELPDETRQIGKVIDANLGNNLHRIETSGGEEFLVTMPVKFRNAIFIKKDSFLMFQPIEEGKQVKGEITHILLKHQIAYIASSGLWPEHFDCPVTIKPSTNQLVVPATYYIPEDMLPPSSDEDDDDDNEFKTKNPNRNCDEEDDEEEDDDDEDDDDDISNDGNNENVENMNK